MVEVVKFLGFPHFLRLKWFVLIVGICHQLERHNVGNTYLVCVQDMAGSNKIASCGTLWLRIENNSNVYS